MTEHVVLVDELDRQVGIAEKLAAHQQPRLHRAFSVFVFNDAGELLLQRRAADKYHSAGLWSNTCCGHPRPGEDVAAAASRRLAEELGIRCALTRGPHFIYHATIDERCTEFELDHIFFGTTDEVPQPDPAEVQEWRWLSLPAVARELRARPANFTVWFEEAFSLIRPLAPRPARSGTPAGS